ncbi:MAG: ATP-binding protein [Gammaproteobacteria bacterium]|nr:ATP-binding protein [Gammaproteobacteria bacterium]
MGNSRKTLNIKSRITEFSSLAQDLEIMRSELMQQKDNIQKREAYISAIMEKMAEPMIILNSDLAIDSINPAAETVFQHAHNDIKGKLFTDLISPDCKSEKCTNIRHGIVDTASKPTQCIGLKKNGQTFPVEFHYSILTIGDEELIICNAHDMTEHKKNEEALIEARSAAEAANQSKSIFLSSMSHELRTPLNAIIGYSEILLEEALDNQDQNSADDLKKIRNSGTHLLSLINNILDLSKIEAGKMDLELQPFELAHLIEDIIFTISPLIDKNHNNFSHKFTTDTVQLVADYTKLKQVLINLIGNAAKFTSNGTISLEVGKAIIDGEENLIFTVKDTGIGIAEEDQPKLFQEFSQANSSVTNNYGGTGLGLAISRKFCQMMGGDIKFSSEFGKGSTFTVNIPIRSVSDASKKNALG